tara:strand:+ start:247 stop:477 length:231 start_codon:yes stop_codon:yes gene_type:complete
MGVNHPLNLNKTDMKIINDLLTAYSKGFITDDELIEMSDLATNEITVIKEKPNYDWDDDQVSNDWMNDLHETQYDY